ncbi:FG-GAP-like repeat-containing protein [Streptomyces tsukubensis]|uniref:FG-GAP-like repeat-containing protein n=1 Tax=Streptomyces tsukubensis TaxID=83656 RepID=UPI0034503182
MFARRPRAAVLGAAAALLTSGLLTPTSAHATTGSATETGTHPFAAHLKIGDGATARACTGALVDAQWVLTDASCFAADPQKATTVTAGKPQWRTTATIGRADLSGTGGHTSEVVELLPQRSSGLVMARLAAPATGITPVAIAAEPPAAGDSLTAVGYGRTKTQWIPNKSHTATFTVDGIDDDSLKIFGKTASDAICKGDTGAPLLRERNGKTELVAIASRSRQGGCMGETETSTDAVALRADGIPTGTRLTPGQKLLPGSTLVAAAARLTMGTDGNLTVVSNAGKSLWSTGTAGNPGAHAAFDSAGNLTVRSSAGAVLWESKTTAADGYALLQERGNLVVYNGRHQSQWSSGSAIRNDVNGDGHSDITGWYTFPDGTDAMHLYGGTGDGGFAAPRSAFARTAEDLWDHGAMKKVSGDFNGDGYADVAVMHGYPDKTKFWTFLGKSNGAVQAPFSSWESPAASWDWTRVTLHTGDTNGDGRDDLIAWYDYPNGQDTLFSFIADSRGHFTGPVRSWTSTTWSASMGKAATGDYNGDGRDDLAVLYRYSATSVKVWTFLATTSGGFDAPFTGFTHEGWGEWANTHLHSGDFDGNGRDDLLFWFDYPDGRDIAYTLTSTSNPNGSFLPPRASLTADAGTLTYSAMKLVVGDYNGDGRDDLAAMYGYSNGTVKMLTWLTGADTRFGTAKTSWSTTTSAAWSWPSTHLIDRYNG